MGKRRASRELALKFLYQCEFSSENVEEQMDQFFERAGNHHEINDFTKVLVDTLFTHAEEIDVLIKKFSNNWALDRMSIVDRNILRVGISELLYGTSTPPKVVINEAVEIAKTFGTQDSPDFINGILDKIFRESRKKTSMK